MRSAIEVLSLALPVLVPGLVLIVCLKKNWLDGLNLPLDGGRTWHGRDVLGPNKTWRGLLIYVMGAVAISAPLSFTSPDGAAADVFHTYSPFIVGTSVGLGYTLGEVINSFIKRRLGIEAGAMTASRWRWVQRPVDLVDGIVVVVAIYIVLGVPVPIALLAGGAGVVIHVATDALMRALRLKR